MLTMFETMFETFNTFAGYVDLSFVGLKNPHMIATLFFLYLLIREWRWCWWWPFEEGAFETLGWASLTCGVMPVMCSYANDMAKVSDMVLPAAWTMWQLCVHKKFPTSTLSQIGRKSTGWVFGEIKLKLDNHFDSNWNFDPKMEKKP